MTRYALGKSGSFRLDEQGGVTKIFKRENERIYVASLNENVSAYELFGFGHEAFILHDGKTLRRVKSRIEIF